MIGHDPGVGQPCARWLTQLLVVPTCASFGRHPQGQKDLFSRYCGETESGRVRRLRARRDALKSIIKSFRNEEPGGSSGKKTKRHRVAAKTVNKAALLALLKKRKRKPPE